MFRLRSGNTAAAQIDQRQMHIGSARRDLIPPPHQPRADSLRVLHHLFLVVDEFGTRRLQHRRGDCSDGVVVRTALQAGEDRLVDFRLEIVHCFLAFRVHGSDALPEENDARSRSTESFVRRRADDVAVLERARSNAWVGRMIFIS